MFPTRTRLVALLLSGAVSASPLARADDPSAGAPKYELKYKFREAETQAPDEIPRGLVDRFAINARGRGLGIRPLSLWIDACHWLLRFRALRIYAAAAKLQRVKSTVPA